nr:eukaryotic translation initiation factor 4E family member 2 related sequence 1 isoform X2 [Oncorhynchus gorbuscha]XP_046185162.1 eukaryotic translation initiation factor 4E family member 2 related sequence 1 isoform X2 [Oncorhynchus gorbuscha]
MSGGKKRSGFQITSVTSDYTQSSGEAPPHVQASSQSNPSLQSSSQSTDSSQPGLSHQQGSFSQPTTPLSLRKSNSQDAVGQGSRFRVVRLGQGHGGPYCRGRWTCTDFLEREEGVGPRWVMDSMRHAYSLESLEGIGLQRTGGGAGGELLGHVRTLRTGHLVHSQDTSHLLAQPIGSDGEGFGGLKPLLHSDPPNPTHLERFNLRVVDSMPPLPSPRPRNIPPPLRLDVDATGRSLLRVSHSQPSSPGPPLQGRDGTFLPSLIPIQTSSAWSMFGSGEAVHLPGDDSLKDDDSEDQDETVCNREEDGSINNNRRKTVSPAVGEHPLQYNYTLWYSRRTPSRPANTQSYEQNIRQIGTVASVEQFWKFYSHLMRPGDLTGHSDFHLFKEGIKPMWEDEANKNGGKWIIRLRKGLASRFWENIILAMLLILLLTGLASRFWENIILAMLLILLLLTGLASRFWENIILAMLLILLLTGLASRFWENIILAMLLILLLLTGLASRFWENIILAMLLILLLTGLASRFWENIILAMLLILLLLTGLASRFWENIILAMLLILLLTGLASRFWENIILAMLLILLLLTGLASRF